MSTAGAMALGACTAWALLLLVAACSVLVDVARDWRYRHGPSAEVQAVIDAERAALRTTGEPYAPGPQPEWHGCPAHHATGWDRAWEARGGIR